jgi:hypothetical protein
MEPISGTDRLLALLRQKLEERSRSGTATRSAGRSSQKESHAEPVGVQALAAIEGHDERQLRRAVVQQLLAEHFGPALINDANFQQIVSRVADAIEEEVSTGALLSRLIADLNPR